MTLVLAFDTATEEVAIGIGEVGEGGSLEVLASEDFTAPRAAMTHLLPAIDALLTSAGVARRDIGAIAVGRGPGSFTGVRIAVATAKGLARGLGVPLWGVSTLDAIARRVVTDGLVGVLGDAMRGEVYPALLRNGRRLAPDSVASPESVAAEWVRLGEAVTLTGNGLAKHRQVFAEAMGGKALFAEDRLWAPTGVALLEQLAAVPDEWGSGDPGALLPIHTRLSDAEEAERARLGTGPGGPSHAGVAGPPEGAS